MSQEVTPQQVTANAAKPHDAAQPEPRPFLNSTEAQLFVVDIHASCDFYTQKLGFTVLFVYGDPPFYGQVALRDRAGAST